MNGVFSAVPVAFLLVLPLLLGLLGFTSIGRDRLSAAVLLAVLAAFALSNVAGQTPPDPAGRVPPAIPGLWLAAAAGLGVRLYRDRRRHHRRSTFESLLVLGIGAILVAALVSLPRL